MYFYKFWLDDEWLLVQHVTDYIINEWSTEKLLSIIFLDMEDTVRNILIQVGQFLGAGFCIHTTEGIRGWQASLSPGQPGFSLSKLMMMIIPLLQSFKQQHGVISLSEKWKYGVWALSEQLLSLHKWWVKQRKIKVWGGEEEHNSTSVKKPAGKTILPIPCPPILTLQTWLKASVARVS